MFIGWELDSPTSVHYVFCCHNVPGVQIFGVLFCLSQHLWTANVRWYCVRKVLDTSFSLFLFLCRAQATRSEVNESLCHSIIKEKFSMNSAQIKSIWICYVFGCCLGVCVSIRGSKTELPVFVSVIKVEDPKGEITVLTLSAKFSTVWTRLNFFFGSDLFSTVVIAGGRAPWRAVGVTEGRNRSTCLRCHDPHWRG